MAKYRCRVTDINFQVLSESDLEESQVEAWKIRVAAELPSGVVMTWKIDEDGNPLPDSNGGKGVW